MSKQVNIALKTGLVRSVEADLAEARTRDDGRKFAQLSFDELKKAYAHAVGMVRRLDESGANPSEEIRAAITARPNLIAQAAAFKGLDVKRSVSQARAQRTTRKVA